MTCVCVGQSDVYEGITLMTDLFGTNPPEGVVVRLFTRMRQNEIAIAPNMVDELFTNLESGKDFTITSEVNPTDGKRLRLWVQGGAVEMAAVIMADPPAFSQDRMGNVTQLRPQGGTDDSA